MCFALTPDNLFVLGVCFGRFDAASPRNPQPFRERQNNQKQLLKQKVSFLVWEQNTRNSLCFALTPDNIFVLGVGFGRFDAL